MPNRMIKDSLLTSDKIADLSDFEFRLWVGLILMADDSGRGDARPAIIKGRAFPLRERVTAKDIDSALHVLAAHSCVSLYTVGGKPYYVFPNWAAHQRIRDCKPKYPGPEDETPEVCDSDTSPQSAASCGDTPPETKPTRNQTELETKTKTKPTRAPAREASSAVAAYLDRVNPSASQQSLELLAAYEHDMGTEVCLRAIDIALDNRKATWAYIRAILQRWSGDGVKCLADIDALEAQHEREKQNGGRRKYLPGSGATAPQPGKPGEADQRAREDMERMRLKLRGEAT